MAKKRLGEFNSSRTKCRINLSMTRGKTLFCLACDSTALDQER